jgi:hypothetical protein
MASGEPNFFDIGGIVEIGVRPLEFSEEFVLMLLAADGHLAPTDTQIRVLFVRPMPEIGHEPYSMFVEGYRVSEVSHMGIGRCEWEPAGYEADRTYGVPRVGEKFVMVEVEKEIASVTNQTPRNSTLTSIEKAFLNAVLWSQPTLSARVYILYAKGTCW